MLYPTTSGKYGCVYRISVEDNLTSPECEIILIGVTEARICYDIVQ